MLWHNNEVYVIDVSQSVESDHPSALDFLRKDCSNVNDFFKKVGKLEVMSTKELFEFVTNPHVEDTESAESAFMDKIMDTVEGRADAMMLDTEDERRAKLQKASTEEAVFMSQFIPRSLNQIAEREQKNMLKGDREEDFVKAVALLTGNGGEGEGEGEGGEEEGGEVEVEEAEKEEEEENEDDSENDRDDDNDTDEYDSDDDDDDDDDEKHVKIALTEEEKKAKKEERKAFLKANKLRTKEENKSKRETKVKKKDKKRAINKAKNKRKGG